MPMPENFKYAKVFRKGKPRHDFYDAFRIRHPKMAVDHRAKIFASFDALKGFGEAICAREVLYMDRIELSGEAQAELNRRLSVLHALTQNSRLAREHRIWIEVTYYVPCADERSEAFGFRGQYRTIRGVCRGVDPELSRTLRVDETAIAFEDILRLENPAGIFEAERARAESDSQKRDSNVHTILY